MRKKQIHHKSKQRISIHPVLAGKEREKIQQDAMEKSVLVLSGIPLIVLRDVFGFGEKRLTRLAEEFLKQLKCVENGKVGLDEIHDIIKKETGMEVSNI